MQTVVYNKHGLDDLTDQLHDRMAYEAHSKMVGDLKIAISRLTSGRHQAKAVS